MPDDVVLPADSGEAAGAAAAAAESKEQAKGIADILAAGLKREGIDQPAAATAETEGTTAAATETVAPEPITDTELTEIEGVLQELGIDLGVRSADVPAELRPAYEALLQSAVAVAEDTLSRQLEASEGRLQYEQFRDSVEKSPDRLLLALSMSHPELITQAADLVAKMNEDPAIKQSVIRELEIELKLQEANRREAMLTERERRMKAQQVISATKRAAREAGVDFETAEKFVALAVTANGGDLEPSEVSEIVQSIKPKSSVKTRVVTPAAAAAARGTPTTSVSQTVAPAATPATPGTSAGLKPGERRFSGGGFRQIVREAVARLGASDR